jgi:putative endonuclease
MYINFDTIRLLKICIIYKLRKKDKNHYWIYMLECKNNNYYTGYTIDVEKRYLLHLNGRGAKYTRIYKPIRIAQCWKLFDTKGQAMKIEAFIKQKPKAFKKNLIENPRELKHALFKKYGFKFKILKANLVKRRNNGPDSTRSARIQKS